MDNFERVARWIAFVMTALLCLVLLGALALPGVIGSDEFFQLDPTSWGP